MGWDLQDAIEVMEYVKAFEDYPESMYLEKAEAAKQLAALVRRNIEDDAELGGWYGELMQEIGEGDELDDGSIPPRGDLRVGRFRVHLVHEGERYGRDGCLIYGKAVDTASGFSYNDCREFGHGLPLVEFYDMTQDPAEFPDGQFVSQYYMSTLLGMGSPLNSIENMQAFSLDGGVPSWTIKGDDVQKVYSYLLASRTALEYHASQDTEKDKFAPEPEKVTLKGEVATARSASAVMADNGNHENRGQDAR